MKKIFPLLTILIMLSNNANANWLTWYIVGRSTNKCSCNNTEKQIKKLKEENNKLKEQIKIKSQLEKYNGTSARK